MSRSVILAVPSDILKLHSRYFSPTAKNRAKLPKPADSTLYTFFLVTRSILTGPKSRVADPPSSSSKLYDIQCVYCDFNTDDRTQIRGLAHIGVSFGLRYHTFDSVPDPVPAETAGDNILSSASCKGIDDDVGAGLDEPWLSLDEEFVACGRSWVRSFT